MFVWPPDWTQLGIQACKPSPPLHPCKSDLATQRVGSTLNTSTPIAAALSKRRYQALPIIIAAFFVYWTVVAVQVLPCSWVLAGSHTLPGRCPVADPFSTLAAVSGQEVSPIGHQ